MQIYIQLHYQYRKSYDMDQICFRWAAAEREGERESDKFDTPVLINWNVVNATNKMPSI